MSHREMARKVLLLEASAIEFGSNAHREKSIASSQLSVNVGDIYKGWPGLCGSKNHQKLSREEAVPVFVITVAVVDIVDTAAAAVSTVKFR